VERRPFRHRGVGRSSSARNREETQHRIETTETHPHEAGTPSPLTTTSHDRETTSPAAHRDERPTRARGNRGHPSPPRGGRGPSDTEVPGGSRSALDREEPVERPTLMRSVNVGRWSRLPAPLPDGHRCYRAGNPDKPGCCDETQDRDPATRRTLGGLGSNPRARVTEDRRTTWSTRRLDAPRSRSERFTTSLVRVRKPSPVALHVNESCFPPLNEVRSSGPLGVATERPHQTGRGRRPDPVEGSNTLRATIWRDGRRFLASVTKRVDGPLSGTPEGIPSGGFIRRSPHLPIQ
jgi:hypothetical protein